MRFPVSFAQQRLWFLEQLAPAEPTYNLPYACWLDGPLDARALQRAVDAIVGRHAALRTSIIAADGVPEQVVADTGTVPIERIELPPGMDEGERTDKAESIAGELARQPFDLATAPLIRMALIVAGPGRHLFVLVMQHSIGDESSVQILIDELSAGYQAETAGPAASLPPLVMEYGDFAEWQRERMQGEELDRELSYWREQLRDAPQLLALPADRPGPERRSARGGAATTYVGASTTAGLAAVAHDAEATMFMVFLTGFAATLSRLAHQDDLLIGTQVSDRTHAELDPLVGPFTNILALRISLADDPTFAELLGRVRNTTVDGLAHRQLPFERLVAELAPARTLAHPPVIQVQFDYGSSPPPRPALPGITARSLELATSTAKLDLALHAAAEGAEGTRLSLEYSTDLFDATSADRFLGCLATLLEHAADAPGTPVAERDRQPRADDNAGRAAAPPAPAAPPVSLAPLAVGPVEPRNPVEAALAQIWGDLLDTPAPVGVHEDFFALGGHSLTATRLVARLARSHGVQLPVSQVFAGPTIAQLAVAVAADPDFTVARGSDRQAELDALSDDELDARLRAAVAERNRRRAIPHGFNS